MLRIPHLLLLTIVLTTSSVRAENWGQWRGPFFNGSTDETGLPDNWSLTTNIAWSADLPGCAASTPIIWEDHVFLSGVDVARNRLQAMCFDRRNGRLLWQHDVAEGIKKDDRSNFASASPATDGKLVVFFFGNGRLLAYDFAGKSLWQRDLQKEYGEFAFLWTFSSSPLLYHGRLYVQVLQRDVPVARRDRSAGGIESFLLALDPRTGKTLWRHVRPSEAVAESREAFSTPIPFEASEKAQILIAGGDALTGHDPQTGRELWRWGNWNPQRVPHWRLVPSPVAGDGIALLCAPKREPVYAVQFTGAGALSDNDVAWTSREEREVSSDVPTPAFYDGDFFVLSDVRQRLTRVEARTGKVKWSIPTPGRTKYEASPLAADGKIFLINFDGLVTIVRASDGEILQQISMDEPRDDDKVRASIAAAGGQLFIRTTRKIYCVGQPR